MKQTGSFPEGGRPCLTKVGGALVILWRRAALPALLIALTASGCASAVHTRPIAPYIDPGIHSYTIRTLAVMPFVVPRYMGFAEGGHQVSASMTNDLINRLHALQLYHISSPDEVTQTMTDQVGPPAEWIFVGNREDALTIAQNLGCDGVLFPVVHIYRQGNLIDSEVEIEVTLIDVFSATTVWSVRENVRGRTGRRSLNQPQRAPSANHLAGAAVASAVDKIEGINREGENFTVSTTSPRRIAGYTVLAAGLASGAVAGYYYYEADRAYEEYQEADSPGNIRRLQERVEDCDTLWMVFGGVSVAAVGTATYLLLTDNRWVSWSDPLHLAEHHVELAPVLTPEGGFVFFRYRF